MIRGRKKGKSEREEERMKDGKQDRMKDRVRRRRDEKGKIIINTNERGVGPKRRVRGRKKWMEYEIKKEGLKSRKN